MITAVRTTIQPMPTMITAVRTMIQGVPTMIPAVPTRIPVVRTMVRAAPTMIQAVPTMIQAVPTSPATSRASSTERRSKLAPVPTMVREVSGKRAQCLSGVRRGRRTPIAFALETRRVRARSGAEPRSSTNPMGSSSRCRSRRQAAVRMESRHPASSSQGRRLVTNPGLSVSPRLASFLGPEGCIVEQDVPRLVSNLAFLIPSPSRSPAQRFLTLADERGAACTSHAVDRMGSNV